MASRYIWSLLGHLVYFLTVWSLLYQEKYGNPGANPTIESYNASAIEFYNATGSLVRLENKTILFYFEKRSSLLQRWRCSCKFRRHRIGSCFRNSCLFRLRRKTDENDVFFAANRSLS
jgi:hypothetical protein